MVKEVIIHVNSEKGTVASYDMKTHSAHPTQHGKPTHIKVQPHVRYDLIEKSSGYAPENIATKRVGDDLYIAFEGSDLADPDVIIEDYYSKGPELIIGQAEDGLYYNYVPESAEVSDAISALNIGDMAGQALGGEGFAVPLWFPFDNLGFSGMELLSGVAGIGAVAIASKDSGGSTALPPSDTPEPVEPTIPTPVQPPLCTHVPPPPADEPGDYFLTVVAPDLTNDNTPTIIGETDAPDGTVITLVVTDANGNTQAISATANGGVYSVDVQTPLPDGDYSVVATLTNPDGDTTDATDIGNIVDTTAPDAPTVTIAEDANDDGYIDATEFSGEVKVSIGLPTNAVAGDILTVTDGTTTQTIELIDTDIANGSVDTTFPAPAEGDTITVIAYVTDQAGNQGSSATDSAVLISAQLSIDDVTVNEDAGTMTFTVTLSNPSTQDVTFDYATQDGTATAGSAYTAVSGSGTISAGNTTTTITVPISDDYFKEGDEQFNIILSNVSANVDVVNSDLSGIGTIEDAGTSNPTQPSETIGAADTVYVKITGDDTEAEGASLSHTVELVDKYGNAVTVAAGETITVNLGYAPSGSDGAESSDYTAQNTVTITEGNSSATVTVPAIDDYLNENDEQYTVTVDSVSQANGIYENVAPANTANGYGSDANSATGTITDGTTESDSGTGKADTVYAEISVDKTSTPEGDTLTYSVNLVDKDGNDVSVPTGDKVNVQLAWSGTAGGGSDTSALPYSVDISGSSTASFTITATDDYMKEGSEPITATITGITDTNSNFENIVVGTNSVANSAITDGTTESDNGTGADDTVYVQLVNDDTQIEGNSLTHRVQLVNSIGAAVIVPTGETVTVTIGYNPNNNDSATSGTDYTENTTVTITGGNSYTDFTVDTIDDNAVESTESYTVQITNVAQQNGSFENLTTDTNNDDVTGTINDNDTAPVVTPTTVNVSEEGLANGIVDTNGLNAGDDTTDATTATGTIASDADGDSLIVTLDAPTETLTSGGATVTWSGAGTNTLTGTANGNTVMTISVDNQGQYSVNLLAPVDHPDTGGEDTLSLTVGVTASDGTNTSATENMTIVVEDDAPETTDITKELMYADTNVQLILDVSESMGTADVIDSKDIDGDGSTTDSITRLLAMQYAVKEMLDAYDYMSSVRVNIVTYSTEASQASSGWVTLDDAKTIIDSLTAGGETNYDEGLLATMENFDDSGSIVGAQNVSYFMTDGIPTYYQDWDNRTSETYQGTNGSVTNEDDGIQPEEEVAWINFLQSNNVTSFAYVLGDDAAQTNVDPIAYDGVNHSNTDGIVVQDISELDGVLRDSVVSSLADSIASGSANVSWGADGSGNLASLTLDGITYTYGTVNDTVSASGGSSTWSYDGNTKELSIETNLGGNFAINVLDGSYQYTASGSQTGVSESIQYSFMDRDGNQSGTTTLTLDIGVPTTDRNPTIYTNTSAMDQEITGDVLGGYGIFTGSGDDWVHNNYIYSQGHVFTGDGEDLISTGMIWNGDVYMGAGDDRLYLLDSDMVSFNPYDLVGSTVNMGDGNDIFYFDFNLTDIGAVVNNNSTIDMGAGKDILVFTQNSYNDFTFYNTANGLLVTEDHNTKIYFLVKNVEHLYFVGSNDSYNISTQNLQTGIVIDGIVKGLYYETSSGLTGYTRTDGSFDYAEGDTVIFKIGDVQVGQMDTTQIEDGQVFLQDIAGTERTDINDEYVENMAVLLQSLDNDANADNGIVITQEMHEAFSDDNFDLATIDEEKLAAIIEETTGKESVSEDEAMEHVENMLIEYGGLSEEQFGERVSDTQERNMAMNAHAAVAGMYGTLVADENGNYSYILDEDMFTDPETDGVYREYITRTLADGTIQEITLNIVYQEESGSYIASIEGESIAIDVEDKEISMNVLLGSNEMEQEFSELNFGQTSHAVDTSDPNEEDIPIEDEEVQAEKVQSQQEGVIQTASSSVEMDQTDPYESNRKEMSVTEDSVERDSDEDNQAEEIRADSEDEASSDEQSTVDKDESEDKEDTDSQAEEIRADSGDEASLDEQSMIEEDDYVLAQEEGALDFSVVEDSEPEGVAEDEEDVSLDMVLDTATPEKSLQIESDDTDVSPENAAAGWVSGEETNTVASTPLAQEDMDQANVQPTEGVVI